MTALRSLLGSSRKTYSGTKSKTTKYPASSCRRLSAGFEHLETRTLLSITITQADMPASGPFILSASSQTYMLGTDVAVNGTAFVFGGKNITLDLNGHTITYGDRSPLTVANGGFEAGNIGDTSISGWNLTNAPSAAIAANDCYFWGNHVLKFTNISSSQYILSDPNSIPVANIEYTATITPKGAYDTTVSLQVIDTDTGSVLGTSTYANPDRAFAAVVTFTPTTTHSVCLKVIVTPASGKTDTVQLDYASLAQSRDYGIIATHLWAGLPDYLQTTDIINACKAVGDSGSNETICNGHIVQGQGNSTLSRADSRR